MSHSQGIKLLCCDLEFVAHRMANLAQVALILDMKRAAEQGNLLSVSHLDNLEA